MSTESTKEEVVPMHLADGLLLAHYKEGCNRICEEVSWLPGVSQSDPYPPIELEKYDYPMAFTHMEA